MRSSVYHTIQERYLIQQTQVLSCYLSLTLTETVAILLDDCLFLDVTPPNIYATKITVNFKCSYKYSTYKR